MAIINIHRAHHVSKSKARKIVQELAENLSDKHGLDYSWEKDVLLFNRSGIKGTISLLDKDVHIEAELGFFFGAFQDKIEGYIHDFLDEHLGKESDGKQGGGR